MAASRAAMVKLGGQKTPRSSWDYQLLSLPGLLGVFILPFQTKGLVSLGLSFLWPSPNPCHISAPPFDTPLHTLAGLPPLPTPRPRHTPPADSPLRVRLWLPPTSPPPAQRRLHGCSAARSPPPRRRLPKVTTP